MPDIRLGRIVLRSWRPYLLWSPSGYSAPVIAHLVEFLDERDGNVSQLGGFDSRAEAEACLARLEAEGWKDLRINMVPIHVRLTDWEWDR
jgi:hypothetical protein